MTAEQPQEKVPRPHITLVCVGKTYIQNGKIGLVFKEINPDGSAGVERIYSQKDLKHVRVGAVYEVEGSTENLRSIFTDTLRWLRLWEDKPEAAAWQAAADARYARPGREAGEETERSQAPTRVARTDPQGVSAHQCRGQVGI